MAEPDELSLEASENSDSVPPSLVHVCSGCPASSGDASVLSLLCEGPAFLGTFVEGEA